MAELEKSGVRLVVENASPATAQVNAFNKALGNLNGATTNLARGQAFNRLNKELSSTFQNIGKSVPGFGKLTNVLGATEKQSAQLATALGGVSVALGGVVIATGAAVAGFAGFVALGKRGAQIQPTINAFGNLASEYGNATEFLQKLRRETGGAVSDYKLMQIATFALSGASKELGTTIFNDLGKNLADISQLATALGRDPVEAQTRWINAIKKGERELLDELGIIVGADEAYEKYAKSINKSASELTESEKKSAFAAEASRQLTEAVAKLGDTGNSVLLIFNRASAFIQNLFDRLSLAIQPAFAPVVQIFGHLITGATNIMNLVIPAIKTLAEIVGTTITVAFETAGTIFQELFGGINQGASQVLPYAIALFQIFGDVAQSVIKAIGATTQNAIRNFATLANFFLKPLGKIGEFVQRLFKGTNDQFNNGFEQLAFNVARGGANIVGAFAAGLLRGGTQVAEAAGKIAQIVADFLVGFSPPKKGALANIDKGAANIAKAFAQGFVGGILPPVEQVAADIDRQLGVIGTFSLDQVKAAFGRLDLAIRPFTEQLSLAKADLEAIAGFIDPALKIAERQRKNLLKAFGRGETADINALRFQDMQIANLKELKDVETDRVDNAELQLGLVTAAQSSERALLAIQQARLGTTEDIKEETQAAEKAAKEARDTADKALKGSGGGASEAGQGESGGFTPGESPDLLGNEAIANAKAQILKFGAGIAGAASQGISQGLQESGFNSALAQFQGATGNVKSQLARAANANPAQSILNKFKGLTSGVQEILNPFKEEFERVFNALFGDDGSISGFVTRWGEKLAPIFTDENSPVQMAKKSITDFANDLGSIFNDIDFTPFNTSIDTTFGMESEDSPFAKIGTAIKGAKELFDEFKTSAGNVFDSLFGKEGTVLKALQEFDTTIISIFDNLFKEGGQIDIWLGNFLLFTGSVIDAVVEKFNLLTGEGEGSIRGALSSLGEVLRSSALEPFVRVANLIIDATEGAINTIVAGFNALPLPDINWSANFGDISIPGAASGALGLKGTFLAGEKGAELITTKKPATVFPAAATRALMSMAAQPAPVYAGYGGSSNTYNNNNMSQSNTFNVNSPKQALLMERQLRASMRR